MSFGLKNDTAEETFINDQMFIRPIAANFLNLSVVPLLIYIISAAWVLVLFWSLDDQLVLHH